MTIKKTWIVKHWELNEEEEEEMTIISLSDFHQWLMLAVDQKVQSKHLVLFLSELVKLLLGLNQHTQPFKKWWFWFLLRAISF